MKMLVNVSQWLLIKYFKIENKIFKNINIYIKYNECTKEFQSIYIKII